MRRGNVRAAFALADSAARRQPRLADVHFQRGRMLSKMKRFGEAEKAYRKALALRSDYPGAWLNLGNNASRQRQYRQALSFYRKAQATHPAKAKVLMGRTYASLEKADSAKSAYRKALAVDSTNTQAHIRLSLLLEKKGQLQTALRHSRRALNLEPENIDYQYIYGAQLVKTGQAKAAMPYLEAVIEKRPWHYGAHYRLGRALALSGQPEEAKRYMVEADSLQQLQSDISRQRELIQMQPSDPKHWRKLGEMLSRLGRPQKAQRAYRKARSLEN
jgi:tetratricopeptide (TPR) repeat protein